MFPIQLFGRNRRDHEQDGLDIVTPFITICPILPVQKKLNCRGEALSEQSDWVSWDMLLEQMDESHSLHRPHGNYSLTPGIICVCIYLSRFKRSYNINSQES